MTSHKQLFEWFAYASKECFSVIAKKFDFVLFRIENENNEYTALYIQKEVAISIRYEPLDNLIIVYIVSLKDGLLPEYNLNDWINVDNIILQQGGTIIKQSKYGNPFSNDLNDFNVILSGYASVIYKYLLHSKY